MQKIMLNDGKHEVSRLTLGTWAFSGAEVWGDCDEELAIKTIHSALDQGINLIDTSEAYGVGQAELLLGKALKGKRNQAVIASKVYSDHLNYEDVITACENSLKRLDVEYIDIYQIHWPNRDIAAEETFGAFEKLQKDGKIVSLGVCNHGINSMERIAKYDIVTNQMPYSLLWRVAEHHFSSDMAKRNIKLWAYSPLAQGLLTGKFRSIDDVPINRRATRMYNSKYCVGVHTDVGFETEIFIFLNELFKICEETGYDMPTLAMNFLKSRHEVGCVLVGARTPQQLQHNIKAFESDVPEELIRKITVLSDDLKNKMGTNADLWQNGNGGRGRMD